MRQSYRAVGTVATHELGIGNKIKPGIFDEKCGIAALLIENSGFYFVPAPKHGSLSLLIY